ncbi:MAG TPA: folylpolyglutamate synthase/dihydrofolate synthase family protein [Ferruginibacter sp.]|nr:folylpolyglutamate synthase/dihydrofolate synthase family protein [Ferruginibacter sp.]
MNYQQTLDYLYAQLPMFSRIGAAAYKKDLHNTIALCEALDNPHTKFKSIHIAGTNGKGSTSHMLAAILQQAGYKTGLYTSPHLKDFRERIRINGEMISRDFVVNFVQRTMTLSEAIQPSFFELTVAMAFDYFEKEKVDIAVIETGLGGRLDSTNIITPLVSIITNIGYDHMNLLGNSLPEIAGEKAGIIKAGVPVVIGEYLPETKDVFIRKARELAAPICFAQEEYHAANIRYSPASLRCDVTNTVHQVTESFELDLNGFYQVKNLSTVLCAEGLLMQRGFSISNESEKQALQNVKQLTGLHGRWEVIDTNPVTVLDVAHNEDGIRQVLKQLSLIEQAPSTVHFVLGMVKDKDVTKALSLLPTSGHYYFSHAHIPRAMPAEELKLKAAGFNIQGDSFDDVNAAIAAARKAAKPGDMILVCGSVFLVAEVGRSAAE